MDKIHHRHRRLQQQQHSCHQNSELQRRWLPQLGASASSQSQLIKVVLLIILCSSLVPAGGMSRRARNPYGRHLVIHVPMKIRSHHHTHTVFTHMKGVGKGGGGAIEGGRGTKQTIYKIMGYSTHHTSGGVGGGERGVSGGHGRGYGHGHGFALPYGQGHRNAGGGGGGTGYGEINYDDYPNTNCDNSMPQGDMIFNHYSRQDEEYPELEELIEDERERDEWE